MADGSVALRTGIHARTLLPSPTYDSFFKLARTADGRCLCLYRDDKHWWEEVPPPKGWNDAR